MADRLFVREGAMLGLDQLDTVLAFTGVMLLLSIVITAIVQIIGSVFNTRGWVLFHGVKQVLLQIAPELDVAAAKALASKVLAHPTVSHQFFGRHAVAITADELYKLLESFLHRPVTPSDATPEEPAAAGALRVLATSLGAEAGALRTRIDAWFDTVMRRSSELFASWSQLATVVTAAILVWTWGIDANAIYDRLRVDDQTRAQWITASESLLSRASAANGSGDATTSASAEELKRTIAQARAVLAAEGLVPAPRPTIPGQLWAWLLLSLGAPFWFNLLRTLSNLRPTLARKTDEAQAAQGDRP